MAIRFKIKHKLFAALLLTSLASAIGLFFFLQWNFDRGFLNYVNSQESELIDLLAERLANQYAKNQHSWDFIVNNHELWQQMHSELNPRPNFVPPLQNENSLPPRPLLAPPGARNFGNKPPTKGGPGKLVPPGAPNFRNTPPTEEGPGPIGRRLVLFDNNKEQIIGGPKVLTNLKYYPISYQKEEIGYLGLIPIKKVSDAGDLVFVEEQTFAFALVTGVMILFSLLVSFAVTSHLIWPVNQLIAGTRKLIGGWFSTRIPVPTTDELGVLSDHFNTLALTLEKNEQARQQWVADISHELRTPLAILQGEVEAIQDGIMEADEQSLAALHSEITHISRLVNDLYELSMTDTGALNYKKITVDPIALLMDTVELFDLRYQKAGLTLEVQPKNNAAFMLFADPDRLQQLFTNLLENSLRYTHAPGKVQINIAVHDNVLRLTFMDSAPGLTPEQLPRIFERLYRADTSRNRKNGGAGLGMALCKNIVTAHHGQIEATQSPLGGILVRISIPQKN